MNGLLAGWLTKIYAYSESLKDIRDITTMEIKLTHRSCNDDTQNPVRKQFFNKSFIRDFQSSMVSANAGGGKFYINF